MEGWWWRWPSFDLVDKIIQWMLPPRLVQLVAVFGFTLLATLVYRPAASKWWILSVPSLALGTIASLFHLKGANKKFIHTEHGE